MILVDTSVWVDHFRRTDARLSELLGRGGVLAHPFVIGELALGNLRQRDGILEALQNLRSAKVASDAEMLRFIAQQRLSGLGIGYVDAHLLAAVQLTPGARLWTKDKRLRAAAEGLSLNADLVT